MTTEAPLQAQGLTPRRAPLARHADPQSARGGAPGALPRCWADVPSALVTTHAMECQALGTERLGLCPRHAQELLGDQSPPVPYVTSRWEVG